MLNYFNCTYDNNCDIDGVKIISTLFNGETSVLKWNKTKLVKNARVKHFLKQNSFEVIADAKTCLREDSKLYTCACSHVNDYSTCLLPENDN